MFDQCVATSFNATRQSSGLLNRSSSHFQTGPTASPRRSIGILMSEALRCYDDVRKRPFDFLDRLQESMLRRAMPSIQMAVRGNVVAADILLDAIIRYGSTPLDIFVHPEFEKDATEYLKDAFDRVTLEKIRTVPIDSLVTEQSTTDFEHGSLRSRLLSRLEGWKYHNALEPVAPLTCIRSRFLSTDLGSIVWSGTLFCVCSSAGPTLAIR